MSIITPEYSAGGLSSEQNGARIGEGPSDVLGRLWNNLSGTTAQNMFNATEAEKARQFSSNEAEKARNFEERMSSTAYQRAAADMKAAGINPAILSGMASGGSQASTPSGNAASAASASSGKGKSGSIIGTLIKAAVGLALMS